MDDGNTVTPVTADASVSPRVSWRFRGTGGKNDVIVFAFVLASAIAGALAGCRPTGTPGVDEIYAGVLAALATLLCSRANRESVLLFAAIALIMSRSWLELAAALALVLAFSSVVIRLPDRFGVIPGALATQVLLRWPPFAFHGGTALIGVAALAVPSVSAYRKVSSRERQIAARVVLASLGAAFVLSLPFVFSAVSASIYVSSGQHEVEAALSDVANGTSASATAELKAATSNFASAATRLSGWWTETSRIVPVVSENRSVLAAAVVAARRLSDTAEDEAPRFDYHRLRYHQGEINLSAISAMLVPARVLDGGLAEAGTELRALQRGWLVAPFDSKLDRFRHDVVDAKASTDLAVKAIPVLPGLLGSNGPRKYFVAFMNPAESRGLDGLVGAYGELTADKGHITMTTSGGDDTLDMALPPKGGVITGLPDYEARYGQFQPNRYFQDVSFSPDLPTVAQVISQLYPQAGGEHVDGVLVLDPYGMAPLLSITGPITVPGLSGPLTSQNVVQFLLKGQYLNELATTSSEQGERHDYLEDILHLAFQRLVNGSLPGPSTLSRELDPAVRQGRIGFWSADPTESSLISALHLDDSFPMAGSADLIAVTTQNAGANKIDSYLHKSIRYRVDLNSQTGQVESKLTMTFRNSAPSSGLSPIIIDSPEAPGTPTGANYFWLSVYSPYTLDGAVLDGAPMTLNAGEELGVHVYSQWVLVPSMGSRTVTLTLAGATHEGSHYKLDLRLQPSVNPVEVVTNVEWHPGAGATATWHAGSAVTQSHTFVEP